MAKIWTEENEQYIRDNYRHKTYAELAEHFGVTQKAMESKIRRMGLKKQDYKDLEPIVPVLPPQPLEPSAPVESGPTPIRSTALLPRRIEEPSETPEERAARLEAERQGAERERERREALREDKSVAAAVKRFEQGLKSFHDGKQAKALEAFQKIVDAAPPDPQLVARAKQYVRGIEERGRSTDFAPKSADDFYLQGVLKLNDGEPGAALEAFTVALAKAPGDDRILYCQAAAHAQHGDFDAALEALREAIEANPANRIYAQNDPDFVPLRVHEDFRTVIANPEAEA